jgi:hypothetical protein
VYALTQDVENHHPRSVANWLRRPVTHKGAQFIIRKDDAFGAGNVFSIQPKGESVSEHIVEGGFVNWENQFLYDLFCNFEKIAEEMPVTRYRDYCYDRGIKPDWQVEALIEAGECSFETIKLVIEARR